ncbi:Ldh family oxidoreductase [Aquabacter sp. CN5-332]|uniref:Ldh family oxidoreductase n=1 Tax=Aquabacter sp. CN5-332 TaxID=3156608 RepID=UPI0032B4D2C5
MRFKPKTLQDILEAIFKGAGSNAAEAEIIAGHLVDASLSGHDSHGPIRALAYIKAVKKNELIPNAQPTVLFSTDTIATLEGNHGYGQVIARAATDLGIEKAKKSGLAMITVRNAGHIGRLGAWAERAAAAGQATLTFVNAARPGGAQLAPFGGTDRRLNAGPICFGMPSAEGKPVVLDVSTASVAMGKIRLARNKKEKLREPCIVDGNGNLSDDPEALYGPPPGAVLPFGGHKGSGLCMFTDLFAGLLSGAGADYEGPPCEWYPINNMMVLHIDVGTFADFGAVSEQLGAYAAWVKKSPPQTPGGEVLMPGEYERLSREKRGAGLIEVDDTTWKQVMEAADLAGVPRETIDSLMGSAAA